MEYYTYGVGIILAGGLISLCLPEKFKGWIVSLFTGAGMMCILIPSIQVVTGNQILSMNIELSYPIGNVSLVIDRLAAFFLCIIAVMSFIGSLYAIGYMNMYLKKEKPLGSHFFFLSLLIASMLLVVVIQNALAFLVAWEIMSLSSFFLVAFENEKEEVYQAGINYLVAMHIGVIFLIFGFVLLSSKAGSFDFNSFKKLLESQKEYVNLIFFLLFIGFGTKAGFIPFHTWLPKAHPAAPSHISGLMSGIMIKTGIYGILRVLTLIQAPTAAMAYSVLIIALISGIAGVAYAITQRNIKSLLAYSSIENIGIIGIGMGIGMLGMVYNNQTLILLGFSGSFLHILNHSIFKSLLFFASGSIYQKTHNLNIEKMGGLIKKMLFTAICFLIGSLAISGLPPFNGFISEFLIYWGILSGIKSGSIIFTVLMIVTFAGLAFIGAMALMCFTNAFSIIFLGAPREEQHDEIKDISWIMRIPMFMQIAMIVFIGLFPQIILAEVSKITLFFTKSTSSLSAFANYSDTLTVISSNLLIFVGIVIAVLGIRYVLLRNKHVYTYKTWDCGYQAGNTRMQYTASSYALAFTRILKHLFVTTVQEEKPVGVFPADTHYASQVTDKVEHKIVNPIIAYLNKFLNAFTWIQSGSTQQYILYGVLFLIAITIWIMVV